MAGNSNQV